MRNRIIVAGIVGVLMISLSGCSTNKAITESSNTKISTNTKEKVESTINSTEDTSWTEESSKELSKNDKVEVMLDSLNQGMSDIFDISFDEAEDKFVLEAKKDGQMDKILSELATNSEEDDKQQLEELSSSLTGFSESISSSLGNDYSIELVNHYNDKGSFFVIKNGEISFPYLENK